MEGIRLRLSTKKGETAAQTGLALESSLPSQAGEARWGLQCALAKGQVSRRMLLDVGRGRLI